LSRLDEGALAERLLPDGGEPPVTCLYSPRGLAWLDTVTLPGAAGTALQRLTQGLRGHGAEIARRTRAGRHARTARRTRQC